MHKNYQKSSEFIRKKTILKVCSFKGHEHKWNDSTRDYNNSTAPKQLYQSGLLFLKNEKINKSNLMQDEFAKMSEEQKLAHIKQVSTEKYSTAK
jgi:hypothetical protein